MLTQAVLRGSFSIEKIIETLCEVGLCLEEVGEVIRRRVLLKFIVC